MTDKKDKKKSNIFDVLDDLDDMLIGLSSEKEQSPKKNDLFSEAIFDQSEEYNLGQGDISNSYSKKSPKITKRDYQLYQKVKDNWESSKHKIYSLYDSIRNYKITTPDFVNNFKDTLSTIMNYRITIPNFVTKVKENFATRKQKKLDSTLLVDNSDLADLADSYDSTNSIDLKDSNNPNELDIKITKTYTDDLNGMDNISNSDSSISSAPIQEKSFEEEKIIHLNPVIEPDNNLEDKLDSNPDEELKEPIFSLGNKFSNIYQNIKNSLKLPKKPKSSKEKVDKDSSFTEEPKKSEPKKPLINYQPFFSYVSNSKNSLKSGLYKLKPNTKKLKEKAQVFKQKSVYKPIAIGIAIGLIATAVYRNWNAWDSDKIGKSFDKDKIISQTTNQDVNYKSALEKILNPKQSFSSVIWNPDLDFTNSDSSLSNKYFDRLKTLDVKTEILGANNFLDTKKNLETLEGLLTQKKNLNSYVAKHSKEQRDVYLSVAIDLSNFDSTFLGPSQDYFQVSDLVWDKNNMLAHTKESENNQTFKKLLEFEVGPQFEKLKELSTYPVLIGLYDILTQSQNNIFKSEKERVDYFVKRFDNPEVITNVLPLMDGVLNNSPFFDFIDSVQRYNTASADDERVKGIVLMTDLYSDSPDQISKFNNYQLLKFISLTEENCQENNLDLIYVAPPNANRTLAYDSFSEVIEPTNESGLKKFHLGKDIDTKFFYEHAYDLAGSVAVPGKNIPANSASEQVDILFKSAYPYIQLDSRTDVDADNPQDSGLYFMINTDLSAMTSNDNSYLNNLNNTRDGFLNLLGPKPEDKMIIYVQKK